MSTAEKSERPEQNPDMRCQSGPSAKDSVFVLVHNFLRKQCNGSKKWSWLIQWMN